MRSRSVCLPLRGRRCEGLAPDGLIAKGPSGRDLEGMIPGLKAWRGCFADLGTGQGVDVVKRSSSSTRFQNNGQWLALIAILFAAPSMAAVGKPCGYKDLMPAYEDFSMATASLSPEEKAAAFATRLAPQFPDFYLEQVYGGTTKLQNSARKFFGEQKSLFPDVPPLDPERVSALAHVVGRQFAQEQGRFMQVFPDFACDTLVEFGVSLLKFDGHPVDVDGKHYLLFGVDTIALLHDAADMPSFLDHEEFHLYHKQVMGKDTPQGEEPAWWTLWVEGLATYVSQRMNPERDAQQVLWYPRNLVPVVDKDLAHAARLMLQDIDKSGFEADRWFLANQSVQGLPPRSGYYLGYLFAKSQGDKVPLARLARTPPTQVHRAAIKFLSALAARSTEQFPDQVNPDR